MQVQRAKRHMEWQTDHHRAWVWVQRMCNAIWQSDPAAKHKAICITTYTLQMNYVHVSLTVLMQRINIIMAVQDKRLFQCGSQEAGLVKYDKYTCKKWAVGLGYNKNTRYKIHNIKNKM